MNIIDKRRRPTSAEVKSPFANVGQSSKSDIGIEIGPQSHGTSNATEIQARAFTLEL